MSNDDKISAQVTVRNMKMTPMEDRPREKALAHGLETLSNAELLATLLGSGVPGMSVVELCEQILYDNDNKLYRLARHSVKDLMRYHGVGEVKALNMLAALELGRRMADEEFEQLPSITDSQKAFRYLRNKMAYANYERDSRPCQACNQLQGDKRRRQDGYGGRYKAHYAHSDRV